MSRVLPFISALLNTSICSFAATEITFGPVRAQPGQSIRLVTHSETTGATISNTWEGKTDTGAISIVRDRDLVWTFRDPAADGARRGMVKVNRLTSTEKTDINGESRNVTDNSPLTGKLFAMSKSPVGDWSFQLDGSLPLRQVEEEINELKVYLKRDWYPKHAVKAGDSWEFDPAWIRMLVERDFSNAQTIGTMTLRQVRHTEAFTIAVIEVSIQSTGANFNSDGSSGDGSVSLTGEVIVNLKTMLDESLELKGSISTETQGDGITTKTKLPIHLTAKKSFVRNP